MNYEEFLKIALKNKNRRKNFPEYLIRKGM